MHVRESACACVSEPLPLLISLASGTLVLTVTWRSAGSQMHRFRK